MKSPRVIPLKLLKASAGRPETATAAPGDGPADPSRRALVHWLAAAAALSAAGCSRPPDHKIYSYAQMPELASNDTPLYYASACLQDGHAHGVLVATQQGRPVKVEGNPSHPASLGTTAAFAQAAVMDLWDPDRSRTPWRRDADGRAAPSTWSAFGEAWRMATESTAAPTANATATATATATSTSAPAPASAGASATDASSIADARAVPVVAVLTPRFTSPSEAAQLARLLARHPGARWFQDDDAGAARADAAARATLGQSARWLYRFDRAELIVVVGGDPFSEGPAAVRHSADWARARAAAATRRAPPARLVALETTPGLAGARADERWALAPSRIEAVLSACAARLDDATGDGTASASTSTSTSTSTTATEPDAIARRLCSLLRTHRGRVLLWGADALSQRGHEILQSLNRSLGAFEGAPDSALLRAIAPPDLHPGLPAPGMLADAVNAATRGEIGALLVLGGNPAYSAPAALRVAEALARVPFSAHLSMHRDETSRLCSFHLPAGHAFEHWGDARAFDGSVTLLQPAIAPLYDTHSRLELLAWLAAGASGPAPDGHALLRAEWQARAPQGDFEAFWRRALRDGVVANTAAPTLPLRAAPAPVPAGDVAATTATAQADTPSAPSAPSASTSADTTLEALFPLDASVHDGSRANNAWLQELPRPFNAITWGNALLLGPGTAARLGLQSGDVVTARPVSTAASADTAGSARHPPMASDASVEVPVWVQPGHAEGAATLARGYGRRAAGSVGDGVGIDTAGLRAADGAALRLALARTGKTHAFARTQIEMTQHDRELARFASDVPAAAALPTLYGPDVDGVDAAAASEKLPAWGMAIDLDACIGCNACTVACQAENNIPVVGAEEVRLGRNMHWIRVDSYFDEDARAITQPVPCMHCENAPCELVCPVGATVHDSEGLNLQVYNRCVGTRFCSNNCPYKVRRFNFRQYTDVQTETLRLMRNPEVTVRARGVMEKCTYCVQRLSHARRDTQKSGERLPDGAVRTACQGACPTSAIHFGDLRDPASDVSRAKASPRHYAMLEELGTRPRTTYLARVPPRTADEG